MTTVACVWVQGHVPFTAEYVRKLAAMTRRWMDRPYRFVCLTDRPRKLEGAVETVEIPGPGGLFGWWPKLRLFDPSVGLSGRVLYLDLDTLIVSALAPVLDYAAPFALVPDGAPGFRPKGGRYAVVKRFNSSVMVWDVGCRETAQLWTTWSPAVAHRLWGDQDHIGEQCPDAATMPAEWFPRLSAVRSGPPPDAKVILAKSPKNAEAARKIGWVREAWC